MCCMYYYAPINNSIVQVHIHIIIIHTADEINPQQCQKPLSR